ncbi:globin domain-containing protein [Ditylenchus destructor]|uniref:Globin domain-containing protein n=1 Tax=Ditylenchus destructor TaxID=166010 RepID=A0AAD4N4W0_9BILA|nr:globin domain-containing protein [Ditylenchus destructor]
MYRTANGDTNATNTCDEVFHADAGNEARAKLTRQVERTDSKSNLLRTDSRERLIPEFAKLSFGMREVSCDLGIGSEPDTPDLLKNHQKIMQKVPDSGTPPNLPLEKKDSYDSVAISIDSNRFSSTSFSLDSSGGSMDEDSEYTRKMHVQVSRLTREQRDLLKESFQSVMEKNMVKTGMSIMLKLFADYPHYKNIWPQFRQIPDSSLMNADVLSKHAKVYMGGLRLIINSMDDDELLKRSLKRIACAHVRRSIHNSHIQHMLPSLLEVVEENSPQFTLEIRESWTTLFDVIANLIDIFRASESKALHARHQH